MPRLTLVRNDQNFYLEFEVRDAVGAIVDLTPCSLRFKMQKYTFPKTLTIDTECEVISPGTLGLCQAYIEDEIVGEFGEYVAELEITWLEGENAGQVLTVPNITVKILKDLPR